MRSSRAPRSPPGPTRSLPRFRLLGARGQGAEGTVSEAIDLFTGESVAVKIGPVQALAREYERAAALSHPHLARPIAFGLDGESGYFAMEYAGELLAAHGGPADKLARVGELCRALGYLHRAGLVHADVKPANVLVAQGPLGPRAVLVDLGLLSRLRRSDDEGQVARGTIEYTAPEVLEGAAPDERADLYSLGVLLLEVMTGRNPFAAPTPAETISRHFELPPLSGVPHAILPVVAKLLAPDPRARYGSADEVLQALASASGLALKPEGQGLDLERLSAGQFFERAREVSRLAALAQSQDQRGASALVLGPPGAGKSRLLGAAKVKLEVGGFLAIALRAGPDSLAVLWRRLGVLADDETPLPELERAQLGARLRQRLAQATERVPLAILLDDLEPHGAAAWLFGELARAAPDLPLVVIAAATSIVAAPSQLIELGPLSPAAAAAKVREALGPEPWAEAVAATVARESSGLPGELEEALRDLAARGLLAREAGRWRLDHRGDLSALVPRDATAAAVARMGTLPAAQRRALGFAAVLGDALSESALAVLLGPGPGASSGAMLEAGRVAGVLEADGAQLRFTRRSLQAAAERLLSVEDRRHAHAGAALISKSAAARARHLFRAHARGALRAALAAARRELRAGSPEEAARLYQMACAALGASWRNVRAALLTERAADALALAGSFRAAVVLYARAASRGGAPGRIGLAVGKALWHQGRFHEVLLAVQSAREAGGDALELDLLAARTEAMLGQYSAAATRAAAALPAARSRKDGAILARLRHVLATCAWHRGDGASAVRNERASARHARAAGDPRAEADAVLGLGSALRLLGRYTDFTRATERALELYRLLGDGRQQAKAWNNLGVARYQQGEWQQALAAWEQFRAMAAGEGAVEDELNALNNLGVVNRDRGDYPRARECLERGIELASSRGLQRLETILVGNLGEVLVREGDLTGASSLYERALQLARSLDAANEVVETQRRMAELELLRGQPAKALASVRAALGEAQRNGNALEEGNLRRLAALALRALAKPGAEEELGAGRAVLQKTGAVLELTRLEMVAVAVALDRGEPDAAARGIEEARPVLSHLGAAPELRELDVLAQALEALRRRSLSHLGALTEAAQKLASLPDREAVLREMLAEALRLTGAERGFVLLIGAGGERRVAAVAGIAEGTTVTVPRSVVNRVFASGEPLAIADVAAVEDLGGQRSILDLGLRSVLCTPIVFQGRQLGVLYLDSRRIGAFLSGRDLPLLQSFASLAAIALENARLTADLTRKAEMLATLSHEFRTPLSAIRGFAELAQSGPGPELGDDLGMIISQVDRLARLIDRTLELSRTEAGAVKFTMRDLAPAEVVARAVDALRPIAARKSVEIDVSIPDVLPSIEGDADRLSQVLTNLVSNALHYTPSKTRVSVRVSLGSAPAASANEPRVAIDVGGELIGGGVASRRVGVVIEVQDRGPGIPPEALGALFTAYFRARNASGGTGLGLMISREIVRQHGGEIRAASVLGQGATFTVVLPARAAAT